MRIIIAIEDPHQKKEKAESTRHPQEELRTRAYFGNIIIRKVSDEVQDESTKIPLDRFADHFRKLNDGPLPGSPVNAIPGHEYNDVTDDEISVEEVKSAINGLKKHKAPGIDTLDPPVYKSFSEPLINHLTMLYNQVLSSGEYPSTWSVGKIKPIFKNGSKSDPNNYRAISLLNVMAKLFSIIINRRLEVVG